MRGVTEIVVYFDSSLENSQRIKTGPTFDGKITDVVISVCPNYYAFDAGNGKLVYNNNHQKK